MIQATRKTGFLIEDGSKMGSAIGCLRAYANHTRDTDIRDLAEWLDTLRAQTYYEPVQPKLITEQIEEVTA